MPSQTFAEDCATLARLGFHGFESIDRLRQTDLASVPGKHPGVYVILRSNGDAPAFLAENPGPYRKGTSPTLDVRSLMLKWSPRSSILYYGQSSPPIRHRMRAYLWFPKGRRGHWGGRAIWQLKDSEQLVVAWMTTKADEARPIEAEMIGAFAASFGRLPYASWRR